LDSVIPSPFFLELWARNRTFLTGGKVFFLLHPPPTHADEVSIFFTVPRPSFDGITHKSCLSPPLFSLTPGLTPPPPFWTLQLVDRAALNPPPGFLWEYSWTSPTPSQQVWRPTKTPRPSLPLGSFMAGSFVPLYFSICGTLTCSLPHPVHCSP